MVLRQQPRRIARELALLGLSQIRGNPEKLEQQQLDNLIVVAIRTLVTEAHETLETASEELSRGSDRLMASEIRATTIQSAKAMILEAIELTQTAINKVGMSLDLPETVQLANQHEVREYALELIGTVHRRRQEIDEKLQESMVDWQLNRLSQVDRDILRIALAEIWFLNVKDKFAINEAVELAKRYSDEDGYRFINGVLRRVNDKIRSEGLLLLDRATGLRQDTFG
jgi:N utilization substance protein B